MGWRSYPLIDERAEPDAFAPRAPATSGHDAFGESVPVLAYDALPASRRWETGDKFSGGFGPTFLLTPDYWTLRARSAQLFETNLYARGLVRRLVTNEINTGLHLEATPQESILGREEDALSDWSEDVETRFDLWASDAWLCDFAEQSTFGELQRAARAEALVAGDVLVVLRTHKATGLPRVQLVSGSSVQTPLGAKPQTGNRIEHGVELDAGGRHVAFWMRQEDGTSKRLPAWGEKSGRRVAWLVYGTDKRLDGVRGKPLLSLILQSLNEIDRYRDAALRKAVVNSLIAAFVKRTQDKPASKPLTGGAIRAGAVTASNESELSPRTFIAAEVNPGLVIQELQVGEEIQQFAPSGSDEGFGAFEEAIIAAVAWANEIPPEILRLSFSSNYSASQAAINEFKMYLNKVRTSFGNAFCQPIYAEWIVSQALAKKIPAPGLIESWRDSSRYDEYAAWTYADWTGQIKPAVDPLKLVKFYDAAVLAGYTTRDKASRELTGTKYTHNVKKLRRENEKLVEALAPLARLEASKSAPEKPPEEGGETDEGESPEDETRPNQKDDEDA